jgi:hypothetical protein
MRHEPDYNFYAYLLTKVQGCACANARDLSHMPMPSQKKLATLQHYLSYLLRSNDLIVLVDNKKFGTTIFGTFLEYSL